MKPTLALLLYINPLFFTPIFCSTLPALECILKMNMAVHRKQQHLSFFCMEDFFFGQTTEAAQPRRVKCACESKELYHVLP